MQVGRDGRSHLGWIEWKQAKPAGKPASGVVRFLDFYPSLLPTLSSSTEVEQNEKKKKNRMTFIHFCGIDCGIDSETCICNHVLLGHNLHCIYC